jgi:hypothetical protein
MTLELAAPGYEAGIVAADAPRLLSFYRDHFGFPEVDPIVVPGICTIFRLDVRGTILRIVQPEHEPAPAHS